MRVRCYINKKQSVSSIQFNALSLLAKSNCNKNVLKAESSTKGSLDHSRGSGAPCTSMSRSHKEEENKSCSGHQESIGYRSNNICLTPTSSNSSCQNFSSQSLPNNFYSQVSRSFSDMNIRRSNFYLSPLNENSSDVVNYNRFHMRRFDSESSNQTQVAEQDFRRANNLRAWEITSTEKWSQKSAACVFSVMSYNVLAQELLTEHSYLYRAHNSGALMWEQRWTTLFKEIKQHNADILCLQEVQESHLADYFDELKTLGYQGIFKKRTGIRKDGCAVYFKTFMFNLIENTTVEFNQSHIPVLDRDNVAIIAKFSPKRNPENEFVVATTHLLYNPRREDVRLAQTQVLLTEVDRISYKRNGSRHTHLPIIITGDFNLKPDSAVYKLIVNGNLQYEKLSNRSLIHINSTERNTTTTGKVLLPSFLKITDNCQHADLVEHRQADYSLKRDDELKLIQLQHSERRPLNKSAKANNESIYSTGTLSHHLALKSAYNHKRNRDIEATTYQDEWITVDYIFYSGRKDRQDLIHEDKLKLISRYSIPISNQLKGLRIPNYAFGSDHLSLVAKFKLDP